METETQELPSRRQRRSFERGKPRTDCSRAEQSGREGWSLVRQPSFENIWDIPHSQRVGWRLGTACNEVW